MSRIPLHYIRAAIETNTGKHLSLEQTRDLLIEEGLITALQAERDARIFTGYHDYYQTEGVLRDPVPEEGPKELRFNY